jgi:hypothetical protein
MTPNTSSFIPSISYLPTNIQALQYLLSQFHCPDVDPPIFLQTIKTSPTKFRSYLSSLPIDSFISPKGVYLDDVQNILNSQILDLAKSLANPHPLTPTEIALLATIISYYTADKTPLSIELEEYPPIFLLIQIDDFLNLLDPNYTKLLDNDDYDYDPTSEQIQITQASEQTQITQALISLLQTNLIKQV